jgi:hypothetical protein
MTTDKKLYTMQSVNDSTVYKKLWAVDMEEVVEKIGVWFTLVSIDNPTPALQQIYDEHLIYVTPRNDRFKYQIGDQVRYKEETYTVVQRRLDCDIVGYRLDNGLRLSEKRL